MPTRDGLRGPYQFFGAQLTDAYLQIHQVLGDGEAWQAVGHLYAQYSLIEALDAARLLQSRPPKLDEKATAAVAARAQAEREYVAAEAALKAAEANTLKTGAGLKTTTGRAKAESAFQQAKADEERLAKAYREAAATLVLAANAETEALHNSRTAALQAVEAAITAAEAGAQPIATVMVKVLREVGVDPYPSIRAAFRKLSGMAGLRDVT